jgi:hypothetical protein
VGFSVFGLAAAGVAIGAVAIGALAIGALGIHHLGMGTGRIEELSIGKLTVDELVVKRRSEGIEIEPPSYSCGYPAVKPTEAVRSNVRHAFPNGLLPRRHHTHLASYTVANNRRG